MPASDGVQVRRSIYLIFFAMIGAQLALGGAAYVMSQQTGGAPVEPIFVYVLVGVATMTTFAIPLLRRAMMPAMPDGGPGAGDLSAIDRSGLLPKYQTTQILTWALCESISLYGLILTVMSHDIRYFGGFAVGALLNFALYRPRGEEIDQLTN